MCSLTRRWDRILSLSSSRTEGGWTRHCRGSPVLRVVDGGLAVCPVPGHPDRPQRFDLCQWFTCESTPHSTAPFPLLVLFLPPPALTQEDLFA